MISEPLPEGGWSTELRTVRDAVICPAETHADTPGVWADGDVEEAVEFAQTSPWPDLAEAYTDVYAVVKGEDHA